MKRSDDPMQSYINAARKTPLLTRDEESELGRRSLAGDVGARDELVRRNLRLVISVADRYSGRAPGDFDDLIGAGNSGLIRSARTFDPSLGRFSTHAVQWIRQSIRFHLRQEKATVRIPMGMVAIRSRVARGIPLDARETRAWSVGGRAAMAVTHHDSQGGHADGGELPGIEGFADRSAAEPEYEPEALEWLSSRLSALDARSRAIVRQRFGLDPGGTLNDAIGERHGISGKRVQQITEATLMLIQSDMPDWMLGMGEFPARPITNPSGYSRRFNTLDRRRAS